MAVRQPSSVRQHSINIHVHELPNSPDKKNISLTVDLIPVVWCPVPTARKRDRINPYQSPISNREKGAVPLINLHLFRGER